MDYIVGNRNFTSLEQAKIYCDSCDFDYYMINDATIDKENIMSNTSEITTVTTELTYELSKKEKYLQSITEGIKKVNNFPVTVALKAGHSSKLYELKNLYNELMLVNPYLFDAEYNYQWGNYKLNTEQNKSKKELDHDLRYCLLYLNKELNSIYQMVQNGEIQFK